MIILYPMATPTLQNAVDYARTLVRDQGTEALTDANAILFANDFERDARRLIVKRRKSLFVLEGTMDVSGGNGIFMLPENVLLIRDAEIDLTGLGTTYPTTPFDPSNQPEGSTLQFLRDSQSATTPIIDFRGDRVEIFPTPLVNVTAGLVYQAHEVPDPFTALTEMVEYPFTQDYYALAFGIAAKYLDPLDADRAAKLLKEAYRRTLDIIDMIGPGSQLPTRAHPVNFGNNGWLP